MPWDTISTESTASNERRLLRGISANCAGGQTPWGTYLSGEENWAFYFDGGENVDADQKRWGLPKASGYRWAAHDERFDAKRNPNEFHRFGWVVEIDPMDPSSTPIKRTALGRAAHEGAWVAVTKDGRAVVYSGEDARFEYIYKFVSRDRIAPGGGRANRELLDHGTLYVARFDADGTGRWLPLVHGQGPLTEANGFRNQAEVLINTRKAADREQREADLRDSLAFAREDFEQIRYDSAVDKCRSALSRDPDIDGGYNLPHDLLVTGRCAKTNTGAFRLYKRLGYRSCINPMQSI